MGTSVWLPWKPVKNLLFSPQLHGDIIHNLYIILYNSKPTRGLEYISTPQPQILHFNQFINDVNNR